MNDRLAGDEEKLRDAVGIFRTQANLHASSSDDALVRYAHEAGKGKPHASMVRECWHDFENGRRYADLRVVPYVIKYQTQEQMFDEPPPHGITRESLQDAERQIEAAKDEFGKAVLDIALSATPTEVEQALAALDRSEPKVETVRDERLSSGHEDAGELHERDAKMAPVGGDDPASPCPHIDMVLDEKGEENVCADCGELLGPASPYPHNLEDAKGSDEGKGKVAASDASGTASDPKGTERSKQRPRKDEEEVLF